MLLRKGMRIRQKRKFDTGTGKMFGKTGKIYDITEITPEGIIVFMHERTGVGMMDYDCYNQNFVVTKWTEWKPVLPGSTIEFRQNGKRVIVRDADGNKACASSHPNDKFNVGKGIELAVARLAVKRIKASM